jgi:hypothetical protein
MSFLDRAKAAAQQAAEKAKETAEQAAAKGREAMDDVQSSRDLTAAYGDLGRKAYELASAGTISHPLLEPLVGRISELEAHAGASADAPVQPEQATDATPPTTPSGRGAPPA